MTSNLRREIPGGQVIREKEAADITRFSPFFPDLPAKNIAGGQKKGKKRVFSRIRF